MIRSFLKPFDYSRQFFDFTKGLSKNLSIIECKKSIKRIDYGIILVVGTFLIKTNYKFISINYSNKLLSITSTKSLSELLSINVINDDFIATSCFVGIWLLLRLHVKSDLIYINNRVD